MNDQRGTVREIRWQDVFPWITLGRTVRLAFYPRVLVLSAVAIVAVAAGWKVVSQFYRGTDDEFVQQCIENYDRWPWTESDGLAATSSKELALDAGRVLGQVPYVGEWLLKGPIPRIWNYLSDPFFRLFTKNVSITGLTFLMLCCLWEAVVWALFGGALTRIAAMELARDERVGLSASLMEQTRRWPSYFFAVLIPLLLVAVLGVLPLWLVGLLMKADFFVFVAGLLWFLVLLVGLCLAVVLLVLLVGWPLMWPTISIERTDAFDAMSRAYGYVRDRPIYYVFLIVVASILGFLGYLVIDVLIDATIYFGSWAVSWGAGTDRLAEIQAVLQGQGEEQPGGLFSGGTTLIAFWTGFAHLVRQAYQIGFFWCSATTVYLLMRRAVDATEMDEITVDEDDQRDSLPPLGTDDAGLPGVDQDDSGADDEK